MLSQVKKIADKLKKILRKRAVAIPFQVVLVGLAVGLALYTLPAYNGSVNLSEFNWLSISCGLVLYIIFYAVLSVHWTYALSIVENSSIQIAQILAFFASQPYKYLPSSIFSMSARSIYSRKIGADSIMSTAKAQLVEYGSIFASGLIIIALSKTGISPIALIVSGLVLAFYLIYEKLYATKHKERYYKLLILLVVAFISWLIAGASLYFIIDGTGGTITYNEALFTNTAAFLASILAVFVPAGIGIREAILFSQNIGPVGAIAWRVCSILIDVIGGVVAILMVNRKTS